MNLNRTIHIALDGLALGNRGGTGRYVELLMQGFARILDKSAHVHLLHWRNSQIPEQWRDCPHISLYPAHSMPPFWGPLRAFQRERIQHRWLDDMAKEGFKLDIVHGPSFVLPPVPDGAAGVLTVHDLAFHLYPDTLPLARRLYLKRTVPDSIRRATLVLADCDAVRDELRVVYGTDIQTQTVLLGLETLSEINPEQIEKTRQKLGLEEDYWLTLSTLEPRKNLPLLVEAYKKASQNAKLPQLVIAGRRGWRCRELDRVIKSLPQRESIRLTGFLSEIEREAIIAGTGLFLAPSMYEGCDLPALEAAARGIPIIASNIPAHRQYLPKTTAFLNPFDIASWVDALNLMASREDKAYLTPLDARNPLQVATDTLFAYRRVITD